VLVDNPEVHEQMLRHLFDLEVATLDVDLGLVAHRLEQSVDQPARSKRVRLIHRRDEPIGEFRQGHQA